MKNLKREILLCMDTSGSVEQVNNYYTYGGMHADDGTGVDVQTHKYNGKELDTMHGLNLYDYQARWYDATIGMFTSMDPLCEKYYHISPYVYCGGNPVNRVDPDGRDIWQISNNGTIVGYYSNPDFDKIQMVNLWMNGYEPIYDCNGMEQSVVFPKGTITEIKEKNRNKKDFSVFSVSGDEAGKAVFELLSNNSGVEYTQAKTGSDEKGLNFITTSGDYKSNPNIDDFFRNHSTEIPYLREMNHNHPQGNQHPSGIKDNEKTGQKAGTWGDIGNAKYYDQYYNNVKYNVYTVEWRYSPYSGNCP